MPRSPHLSQIWFRVSSRGRNELCRILLQSAHGFRICYGSKFDISHWLGRSPLTQCWHYRAACDFKVRVVIDADDILRAQLTRDLFAIAKFLLRRTEPTAVDIQETAEDRTVCSELIAIHSSGRVWHIAFYCPRSSHVLSLVFFLFCKVS